TNELPRISDTSGALVGRLIVLVLRRSFYGREDPALTARLLTELPGILNWAVHGYRRLRQRGYFVPPATAREALEDLEVLASPIKAFINGAHGATASAARSTAPSRPSAATSKPPSRACDPHARGTMTTATAATRASD